MDDPEDRRDRRRIHGCVGDIQDADDETLPAIRARIDQLRQSDPNKLIGGGIAQVVAEIAGETDHAITGRSGVGRHLARGLKGASPDGLIAFGAQIPIIYLVGDIADNGGVHVVERDAVFVGREEAVIGLGEHGGEGQGVAFVGVDDK